MHKKENKETCLMLFLFKVFNLRMLQYFYMDPKTVIIPAEVSDSDDGLNGKGFPSAVIAKHRGTIISGEASESDDDGSHCVFTGKGFPSVQTSEYHGTIMSGEISDSEIDDGSNILIDRTIPSVSESVSDDGISISGINETIDTLACMPYVDVKSGKKYSIKYNSLLHKKLYECNKTLNNDITQMVEGTVNNAVQELSTVNRQLLKNELTLQEAVCQLRSACSRTKDASNALKQLVDCNFLQSIKT